MMEKLALKFREEGEDDDDDDDDGRAVKVVGAASFLAEAQEMKPAAVGRIVGTIFDFQRC